MRWFGFSLVVLCVLSVVRAQSAEWTQWQGPTRDGVVERDMPFPGSLSEDHLKPRWSAALAEGYSSPVVSDGRVFTLESREEAFEIARAFDLESGFQVWQSKWEGAMKVPFFAKKNGSWVKSTPTVVDGAVFFGGMRDVLAKLDAATGREIWRLDFPAVEKTQLPAFGHVASPVVDGAFLYTQAASAVIKIDKETGNILWRSLKDDRAMFGSAFSSPVLATIHGEKQLVVQTRMNLAGLDVETGKTRWTTPVKAFRGMNILTPTVVGNRIFTAAYGGGVYLFEIEATGEESQKVKLIWNKESPEGYMASPQWINEHIYLYGRDRKLHCLNASNGEVAWSSEETFGQYWSMIRKDQRILALDQTGELILFDANPEGFQLLDRRRISSGPTWAHLGLQDNALLVRGLKNVAVFDWD